MANIVLPQPQLNHELHRGTPKHKPLPIATSWSGDTLVDNIGPFHRSLGDSELSYYLPSRQNGVNDM